MADENVRSWLQKLQSFLYTKLYPVVEMQFPTPTKAKMVTLRLVDVDAMPIWSRAFTHETVSPSDNYEDLEYAGDAVLKWAFPKYLKKRFPYHHKGEYTELNVAYMSKISQAQLAREMGLSQFVRVSGMDRAILNLETDVFESFFGALEETGDLITEGLGTSLCYTMIYHLFQSRNMDESKVRGSAKTQVIQMFVRFDLPKPREIVNEGKRQTEIEVKIPNSIINILRTNGINVTNPTIGIALDQNRENAVSLAYSDAIQMLRTLGILTTNERDIEPVGDNRNVEFTVALRPEHLLFLESYQVYIKDRIIGHAIAPTKKEAEFEAYTRAFDTLRQYGITTEWAEEAKQRMDFGDPAIQPYIIAANNRLIKEGYISMYFFIPRKTVTPKGAIVQLIGIRGNGQHEVLSFTYTLDRDNNYKYAKSLIVQQYANGPK